MFQSFVCLLCVVLGFGVMLASGQNSRRPECNQKRVESCSNRLIMLGDRTFVFPESMEQMNKRCKELKSLEKCLKDYASKCLPSASKSAISVLAFSIARTNKGYCSSHKRKTAFVSFGGCVNSMKKELDTYVEQMNADFHAIITHKEQKLRIPMVCCSYYSFKSKVVERLSKKCRSESGEVETLIDSYAQDILNLICSDYTEDSDKCANIKVPQLNGPVRSKSFIHPLAQVFESIE